MNTQHFPYKYAMFLSRLTHIYMYLQCYTFSARASAGDNSLPLTLVADNFENLDSWGKTLSASKDIGR